MQSIGDATQSQEWQTAVSRSLVYTFLSRALAHPAAEHLAVLTERVVPVLAEFVDDEEAPAGLRDALRGVAAPLEELRDAHTAIFTMTVSPDCPDYETAYCGGDVFKQAHAMADVAGFYRAHGLEPGGQQYERPDHITTELEFMGFLARKEAYAIENLGKDEVQMCTEAQALFLQSHLGCWGPSLGRRIEAQAGQGSLYQAVGRALASWLAGECARFDVVPEQVLEEPTLDWLGPDDGECGAEAGTPVIGIDDIPVEG